MKIRKGFVSNSSSSSFIVLKKNLDSKEQRILKGMIAKSDSEWNFKEDEDRITGYTSMDNYDLEERLKDKGFNIYAMSWNNNPGWAWCEMFWNEGRHESG